MNIIPFKLIAASYTRLSPSTSENTSLSTIAATPESSRSSISSRGCETIGASFTAFTVRVKSVLSVNSPSLTVTVTKISPLKLAIGVTDNKLLLIEISARLESPSIVNSSKSPSTSSA